MHLILIAYYESRYTTACLMFGMWRKAVRRLTPFKSWTCSRWRSIETTGLIRSTALKVISSKINYVWLFESFKNVLSSFLNGAARDLASRLRVRQLYRVRPRYGTRGCSITRHWKEILDCEEAACSCGGHEDLGRWSEWKLCFQFSYRRRKRWRCRRRAKLSSHCLSSAVCTRKTLITLLQLC